MPWWSMRFLVVLVLMMPSRAGAQGVDAQLHGVIRDRTGAALPGTLVSVSHADTSIVRSATTDDTGRYWVSPLPAGSYTVKAERAGFRTETRPDRVFPVGERIIIDFVLEVAATQSVDVVEKSPALETTRNTLSRLVTRDEIDLLPVVDRNFNALASLAPDVTATGTYSGVDIGGSRDFQNGYNIDGVSAEGLGAGEQRITYAQDWIQEFQVLTGQYPSEFGRASGGVLNAITRSGSNVTRGRVYSYFRDQTWDATPAFATEKSPLASRRVGGTVGGPLIANRMFGFAGAEWLDNSSTRVVNSGFAQYNGNVTADSDQKLLIAKLDHQSGGSQTFRFRFNTDRRNATNDGVGGRSTEEYGRSVRYTANDALGTMTQALSNIALNELRSSYSTTSSRTTCNYAERRPQGPWITLQYPTAQLGCFGDGFGYKATSEFQLIDNLSLVRGAHNFKAGVQLLRSRSEGDFRFVRDGIYRFQRDLPFSLNNPQSYPFFFARFEGPTTWDYAWWSWGIFAQDSWRVTDDLTVNAGLRYDRDGAYTALNSLLRTRAGLSTVDTDHNNIAPRAGITWSPSGNSATLIRGGVGAYYDDNHANIATLLLLNGVLVERATLIQANDPGLNPFGPDVARAQRLLAEALAQNTVPSLTFGGIPDLERDLQVPFTVQSSVGAMHRFRRHLEVSADVFIARGYDQFLIRDVNIDRDAALLQGRIVRPNPAFTFINRYGNNGLFRHRALQLQARYEPGVRHLLATSYTLATTKSNTRTALEGTGGGPAAATNPFNFDEDYGPADHDVRHNLVVNGSTGLPFDVMLSGILTARSPLPFSATTTQQLDADPFVDRPEPRNSRRGDRFVTLDIRASKAVRVGRVAGMAFVEVFNLTNEMNFTQYTSAITSTRFAQPSAAFDRRRAQIGFRVDF